MRALIVDLDGTLADVSHRIHHLLGDEPDWKSFHDAMGDDPVIEQVAELVRLVKAGAPADDPVAVLVVTARHDEPRYEEVTRLWLEVGDVPMDRLYMRRDTDTRPDVVVKAEILERILADGYTPVWAIDDRPDVLHMWRNHGIIGLQCAEDPMTRSRNAGETLLTLAVGPCAAGKSTYLAKHYPAHEIVSTDELRMQLYGDLGHSPEALRRVWKLAHGLIRARLMAGCHTVLDATNLDPEDRAKVLALLPQGVFCRYLVIDRDLDTKLRERGWRPEELVMKTHRLWRKHEKSILAGDDHPYVTVQDKRTR